MAGPPPSNDHRLVERLRAGDEAAFEGLSHAEYGPLCAFAERTVHSAAVAEEIVQSTFLQLWRARSQLGPIRSLRAYLYRATRNAALDHLKHAAVEAHWERDVAAAEEREADVAADAQVRMEDEERSAALHAAIGRLSPRAREVVTLRWMYGMTHADVAEALGISVKGVEIQITRALRTLRAHLRPADQSP